MSFSIEPKTLKKLVDFYHPNNKNQQMKYMLFMKGEDQMYMNLQTSPFQGISDNSIEQRVAWFGKNKVNNPFDFTFIDMIIKSLTQYTCMVWLFVFSSILFVIGLFFQYNSLKISQIEGLIGLVLYFINSVLIAIIEYGRYEDFKRIYNYSPEKNYCDVWRQNQQSQIDSQNVVVGDVVQLGVGAVIPADGWMIEGQVKVQEHYSYGTIEASKTTMKGCVNQLDKTSKTKTKRYTIANKIKPQSPTIHYSPIVLGGSTVTQGQGRMMVLCVGKFSRKGEFQLLLKNFNPHKSSSQLQGKIEEFTSQLFKLGIVGVLILVFGLICKEIVTNIISPKEVFADLLKFSRFEYITLSLNFLLYLVPQCCILGLGIGFMIHKKKLELSYQINIKRLVNCESMSYAEYICHEKESQKSYFRIREWWNSGGRIDMDEQLSESSNNDGNEAIEEERLFKNIGHVNQTYLKFFRKAMTVTSGNKDMKSERSQKSLKYGSFRNLDECFIHYSKRKSYIALDQMKEDEIIEQIPYDNVRKRTVIVTNCPQDIDIIVPKSSSNVLAPPPSTQPKLRVSLKIQGSQKLLPKYGSFQRIQRKVIVYVRGKHETVLELCNFIMCKETGKVEQITEEKAIQIKATIDSMLRRQLRAVVLGYKITTRIQSHEQNSEWQDDSGYVLLAIIGINDTRSTNDFELLTKIKQLNINLMISSSNSMEESVSAANQIGIIKADESSILINGSDFMHIVGGILCSQCKKPMCVCEHGNEFHKIKNIDEFQRILKHLDVLANAQAFHKYTLVMGLKNKNICSAVTGKKVIDIPSMMQSEVALLSLEQDQKNATKDTIDLQKSAYSIEIPDNSVVTLFYLIKQSRICYKFIRKFIRLATCSCVVATIYLVLGLLLFKQDFGIKMINLFWIQTVIMVSLALALVLDSETDDNESFPIMNENIKNYNKNQPLINSQGWKQIVTFSLTQLIMLFIVTFLGPVFIPQKQDDVDTIIGDDWMAKYTDSGRSTICSGLPFSIQDSNWQYNHTFSKYGIYSRHQTVIFALYSIMQIFNYFNFRQFNMKEVNIFKNFKIASVLIVLFVLIANVIYVQNAGDHVGFYRNGLLFEQWVICFGISMILWVVGIMVRLFPNLRKEDSEYKIRWQNKAYNLAVKSVITKNELSDFEVDQYFQLKPEIFQTRKND